MATKTTKKAPASRIVTPVKLRDENLKTIKDVRTRLVAAIDDVKAKHHWKDQTLLILEGEDGQFVAAALDEAIGKVLDDMNDVLGKV